MSDRDSDLRRSQADLARKQEKRSEWRFGAEQGSWRWNVLHPDGSENASQGGFPTLKECIADATRHGYVVWIPEAERRKMP